GTFPWREREAFGKYGLLGTRSRDFHPSMLFSVFSVSSVVRSETWKIRKFFLAAVHVHGPVLGAALQRGHRLAGVEQAELVEHLLDRVEGLQLAGAELHAHLVDLFDAHAVLAGDGAADLDAQLQDGRTVGFRA